MPMKDKRKREQSSQEEPANGDANLTPVRGEGEGTLWAWEGAPTEGSEKSPLGQWPPLGQNMLVRNCEPKKSVSSA